MCYKLSIRNGFTLDSCSPRKIPAVSCLSNILFAILRYSKVHIQTEKENAFGNKSES